MRALALLLLSMPVHAEVIRYYLHDATIGSDPRHAVNAPVSGIFDFDASTGRILDGRFIFDDAGYGILLTPYPVPSTFLFEGSSFGASSVTGMFSITNYEFYMDTTASIYLTQPLGGLGANIDLSRSFVSFTECAVFLNACRKLADTPTVLRFNGGFTSVFQTNPQTLGATFGLREMAAPVANPEPSTLILSGTCVSLFAFWMKRQRRRLS